MNLKNIREMARSLGVKNYSRYRKDDLIRAIQEKEGNEPCFKRIDDCRVYDCLWRQDCQESTII
ncbi:MAG: Rho termination factor N-terminal domain-containing protein [Desulfobacteraceae bacterium]